MGRRGRQSIGNAPPRHAPAAQGFEPHQQFRKEDVLAAEDVAPACRRAIRRQPVRGRDVGDIDEIEPGLEIGGGRRMKKAPEHLGGLGDKPDGRPDGSRGIEKHHLLPPRHRLADGALGTPFRAAVGSGHGLERRARIGLADRHRPSRAPVLEHKRRRGHDGAAHARRRRGIEHRPRAAMIDALVDRGVGRPQRRLRGEMMDDLDPLHGRGEHPGIEDRARDRLGTVGQTPTRRRGIEHAHMHAGIDELTDEMMADEAGAAGDEHAPAHDAAGPRASVQTAR